MYFHHLLLLIIQKFHGERSSTAPFYLLKGKKSGQTIQDVTYFKLHPFFSLYPKLSLDQYNVEILTLVNKGFIEENGSVINLTEKGLMQIKTMKDPQFNGWLYRGNEHVFWSRMELVIQTLSHFQANVHRYVPNQKNQDIHQFVKGYLYSRDYKNVAFYSNFRQQLLQLLENTKFENIHREIFVYRLSGYGKSGLTWEQLARHYNLSLFDIKMLFIESLHIALPIINEEKFPDLLPLVKDVEVQTPLTESAMKTYQLIQKGHNLQEIAAMRFLKFNTIEDHIIEIVSANQYFPFFSYISNEQVEKVLRISNSLQTKKLKIIREQAPELSFFQIRIALAKGEEANG
ncbi:helix-turn-helix domain-containing protein [Psychrobacillus sp. FJAT-51614]|uniref:Helix-turn-helix domain-containing protein n=1 Tax=Psychrobacillus mangrovi TaxID=3117745 RepID=A0ABU8F079_9BACI